jgi:hypothetical protein
MQLDNDPNSLLFAPLVSSYLDGAGRKRERRQVTCIMVWFRMICGAAIGKLGWSMARQRFLCRLLIWGGLLWVATTVFAAGAQVERIGGLSAPAASDALKQAVEGKGHRITLDGGWSAEFWFAKQLKTAAKDVSGALYPELANGEFVGVVNLPKGMTDFRGQAIPPGVYTLRYQLLPQDGNHLGVAPNPDFLLAIPVASDPNPEQGYLYKRLVALSAKATGTSHPAVIALDTAGDPDGVVGDAKGVVVFTVAVPSSGASGTEKLGIVVKGTAAQ